MKYSWIILLTGWLPLFGSHMSLVAQNNDIYFKSLIAEQSLSQLTVSSIFQDSKGFLWFGTLDGLNRYDGYNIKVFRSTDNEPHSISSNHINAITEDSLGYLWIGTDNGLNRYCRKSGEFISFFKDNETEYNISHDKVSFVYRDKLGRIWIGTEQGIDYVNQETLTFTKRTFNHFLYNNRIITIHDDSYGNLWIGTVKGLVKYNVKSGKHSIFRKEADNPNSISTNHVRSVFEDSRKNLWVGTSNGLNLYDPKNDSFRHFGKNIYPDLTLTNNAVRCIVEDAYQNLLIGTNKGLNIFNLNTKTIKKYVPDRIIPGSLNHFFIYSLFVDNAETVWIGTFNGGVNYFNQKYNQFRYLNPANDLVYGGINKILLEENDLWVGTDGGGLLQYDQQYSLKNQYLFDKTPRQFSSANFIHSIIKIDNTLLIGTEADQLLLFDINSRKITETINSVSNNFNNIYKTYGGEFLFCVNDTLGLRRLNLERKQLEIVTYQNDSNRNMLFPFPTCIVEESPGVFWIGTRYVGLYYYDSNKQSVKRYMAESDSLSLRSNYISSLYMDNLNNLWIGTNRGLSLFSKETESFHSYDSSHGLLNMDIRGIVEDEAGYLWIATFFGVSRFDPTKNEFINFNKDNGFPIQEISRSSFTLLENGHIAVGGNNGFTIFNPLEIKFDTFKPPVLITDFRLFNTHYFDNPIKLGLLMSNNKPVELRYNQSNFTIEFTALDYIFPKNIQYAYKLDGFDTKWNYVGNQRTATYTNLNAGDYLFRIKASNNGSWDESRETLAIKVYPPLWKTWWAYAIYISVTIGLLFLFFHYFRLKNQIRLKQLEQENMEKTHQLRLRMFTNFSQELRTPLTLILSPLEDLMNDKVLPKEMENALRMIRKNTNRLKMLVDQLIDFRKQESGKIKLKAAEGKFSKFITEITMAFNALAVKQKISYKTEVGEEAIYIWFDRQQMEKVFFNLLSNAFNNTPAEGYITISVEKYDAARLEYLPSETRNKLLNTSAIEFVETRIRNSGKGIPQEEYEKIFDPFYQMTENTGETYAGTGIGLSLVKGITELHHGIVSVDSTPGESTTFRVILPVGKDHLSSDEIQSDYIPSENIINYHILDESYEEEISVSAPIGQNKHKYTILLIDDNADIRDYLRSRLIKEYNIIEASDGKEGLAKALEKMPDLIISDIMIPEIDGLQLCLKLKTDISTCHIPIILLTARTTYLKIKEVYEVGADDYIIKPFSANLLRLKIKSILINRERLKQVMGERLPHELRSAETASMDEQFLDKVYQTVEMNISNPDFLIDDLGKEIGMSRSTLYRKIKALTNYSPNEFIKNYRLRVAAKYLRETDLSISEIAYKTGFNNPAYFTSCFRKFYKTSPSNFMQNFERPNNR